jgi:hypothetical protein
MLGKKKSLPYFHPSYGEHELAPTRFPMIYFMNKGTFTFVAALNDKRRRK